MINKIKIKTGLLKKLLGAKTFKFSPDLTVVWAGNGVGKSVLLKTIAKYCCVDLVSGGGWSQDRYIGFHFSNYNFEYNNKDKNLSNTYEFDKDSKIDIDWSGDAAFYMHHDDMIDWHHIMGYEMGGFQWINGIGKIRENVHKNHSYHPSSGQQIKGITDMLMDIKVPDLTIDTTWKKNQGYDSDFITYIKKRKETWKGDCNKPTLILDELDSQLDMKNQIRFHEEVLPKLVKKYQVILVSHSIFATKHKNIIDLDGSLDFVKQKVKEL